MVGWYFFGFKAYAAALVCLMVLQDMRQIPQIFSAQLSPSGDTLLFRIQYNLLGFGFWHHRVVGLVCPMNIDSPLSQHEWVQLLAKTWGFSLSRSAVGSDDLSVPEFQATCELIGAGQFNAMDYAFVMEKLQLLVQKLELLHRHEHGIAAIMNQDRLRYGPATQALNQLKSHRPV